MKANVVAFSKEYAILDKQLHRRVTALSRNPNVGNVHDVRTSLRKVEAGLDLLPRSLRRKRKFRKYRAVCRELFKTTTPIRDSDTITSRLSPYRSASSVKEALTRLESRRQKLVRSANGAASALQKVNALKFSKSKISNSKFSTRRRKLIRNMEARLLEGLPVVLNNPSRLKEMHSLRKESKVMRYTLEMLPLGKEDKSFVELLKKWQSLLGEVRDCDVIQKYIHQNNLDSPLTKLLIELRSEREKKFESFASSAKTDLVSLPPLSLLK